VILKAVNAALKMAGLRVVPRHYTQMVYQHDYGQAGYEEYKRIQVLHNRRKLNQVWADDATLSVVASYVRAAVPHPTAGLCHGTRNGYEQKTLSELLGIPVLGTEISDTAAQFPSTVHWDFHDSKEEWRGRFSFVYSNSLDQAFDPKKALETWIGQVDPAVGVVVIEHTMAHSTEGASEMDPFGAHPMAMPYLFFEWGRDKYQLVDIVRPTTKKANSGIEVWLFVLAPRR